MIPALLALSTACTMENELVYRSTLPVTTRGVAMSEDGIDSYVAMRGTTCTISTAWGCAVVDVDLPTEQEKIVDHYQGKTLAQSAVGIHHLTGSAWDAASDLVIEQVRIARLSSFGSLVVHEGARGCELVEDGQFTRTVPDAACNDGASADVDRENGALWVTDGEQLVRLGLEDVATWGTTDDLLTRDDALHRTYLSEVGTRKLRAVDDLGRDLWSITTEAKVTSIATRGGRGDVLVLGERAGRGLLERRDGEDGALLASYDLPSGEGELVVSSNGVGLGIQTETDVHYYVLEIPGEAVVIDEDPVTCPAVLNRMSND